MGLEITAYAVPAPDKAVEEIHRWSQHHGLLDWFEKLALESGDGIGREGLDEPGWSMKLTSMDLDRLEAAVTSGELNGRWTPHDRAFIEKARGVLAASKTILIEASW
jgi:hypothetical protein